MELDDRTKRALFRFQVIAPLTLNNQSKEEKSRLRKEILERWYTAPDGKERKVAVRTLRYWIKAYEKGGFEALYDGDRGTYGTCRAIPELVLKAAANLRRQESGLSTQQILDLLPSTEELENQEVDLNNLVKSTLNRQLKKRGAGRKCSEVEKDEGAYQRWEQKFVNDVWQGDCSDGPWLLDPADPKTRRKTYLISFIDDASRVVTYAQFYFDMQLPSMLDCFKKALLTHGKPIRCYTDNAFIYHSTAMTLLCAQLDIKCSFSRKKRPPGRGKIERHIRTVQEGFMLIAEHADVKTIDELNQFFFAWLTEKYHNIEHSELRGLAPMQRWQLDQDRIKRTTPAEIRKGLMLRCQRRVDRKTAELRLNRIKYQASAVLAGQKVELRFHFDDESEVEIWQRGKFFELAKPVVVGSSIDFKRHKKKEELTEKKRGTTFAAFKTYRQKLVKGKTLLNSVPVSAEHFTEKEFVDAFSKFLARALSESEDELLRNFFYQHAPFPKDATNLLLEKLVAAAGSSSILTLTARG